MKIWGGFIGLDFVGFDNRWGCNLLFDLKGKYKLNYDTFTVKLSICLYLRINKLKTRITIVFLLQGEKFLLFLLLPSNRNEYFSIMGNINIQIDNLGSISQLQYIIFGAIVSTLGRKSVGLFCIMRSLA